jgi:hypothetical protein
MFYANFFTDSGNIVADLGGIGMCGVYNKTRVFRFE